MKTIAGFQTPWHGSRLALFFLLSGIAGAFAQSDPPSPNIRSVRVDGTNVVVTAAVPAGLRRVTLECRERLGPGGWEPRAVVRLDGAGGDVQIRVACARSAELMRVRADVSDPLPAAFYGGTNAFYETSDGASGVDYLNPMDTRGTAGTPPAQDAAREVVESDIWKIRGQTLYFFNQLRGLHVIDISNPDSPSVRGTLELPAAGEDLYVLNDSYAVLLARNGCTDADSQVLIVGVGNGSPSVAARLPVGGYITESRLVGTALYVASQSYRPLAGTTNTTWEWGTLVSSFDLADPAKPAARGTLWYSGYANVVTATDRLLFVVTQDPVNWWQSTVRSIDITAPDGTMRAYESIRTSGRVPDKFKLRWEAGVLTSISEDWRSTQNRRVTTRLETFRLPDPRAVGPGGVSKLGELELGRGEQLHATRFDGNRAYVVTFFRIDPLWVVDLSDATSPRIAGSVDVSGWSTFIQPLDDRLVTIGIEGSRVAVSLFDVANPAAPALLNRVRLGQNYSYSEATWDEKAFSVLPDAGLILVPFTGDTTNGYASSVQLVDLNADSLVARGIIEHQFQPRRATLYHDRILSISEWQLLSVDASDRDHPRLRATTTLAFPVDRVFLHGDFLIEVSASDGWGWYGGTPNPLLRVAAAASPGQVLGSLELPKLPVVGATQLGNNLYVLQGQQQWYYPPIPLAADDPNAAGSLQTKTVLTVVSLDNLPALGIAGQVEAGADMSWFSGDFEALWPKSGTLVFAGGGFGFWPRCFECPVPLAADAVVGRVAFPWWGGGGGGQLIAFDVSKAGAPALASSLNLGSNVWWNFSTAFTADGLVYLSHQTSAFIPFDTEKAAGDGTADPALIAPIRFPPGTWISRSFLDVVDYADASHPLVRQPVNIPGRLNGVSHQGSVLYTVGTHWTTNALTAWTQYLDASAYDGVSAHLIDSLVLPSTWPRPLLIRDGNIFLGVVEETSGTVASPVIGSAGGGTLLQTWRLSDAGKFTRLGSVRLETPTSSLAAFGNLLAAQQTDNSLVLFDASNVSALRQVGAGGPGGCTWYDLTRADGALGRGVWLPLGAYGVAQVEARP